MARFLMLESREAKMNGHFSSVAAALPRTFPDSAKKSAATRILIVDDEPLVRWAIGETLRDSGYEIAEAGSGESAKSAIMAPATAPNLVLLDLHLPDSSDLSVLWFIRAGTPKTPVVLMTAHGTPEIIEQAASLGAVVVNKPFDMNELTAIVESALARGVRAVAKSRPRPAGQGTVTT
jgi:DNA-binding NtrC family response regulator